MRYAFGAFILGCLLTTSAFARDAQVDIRDNIFIPESVTITAGSKITWFNHDDIPHNIANSDKSFRSPPVDMNEKYTRAFPAPGTYHYFCTLHPEMVGTIIVTK